MTAAPACTARPDRYGVMRCTACRVSWDRDDVAACPRSEVPGSVQEEALRCGFVSALAPPPNYFDQGFK